VTAQGVADAAGEVEEPPGQLAVDPLEVEDHRLGRLELVGDLLRVGERLRRDHRGLGLG
jgi:hypothetical protein